MRINDNIKWLVRNNLYKPFYAINKFGVSFVLFINTIFAVINHLGIYKDIYDWSVEITGYGLMILAYLSIIGFMYKKCIYYHLSVLGLGIYAILNIIYYYDYNDMYFTQSKAYVGVVVSLFVLTLIIKEEWYDRCRTNP